MCQVRDVLTYPRTYIFKKLPRKAKYWGQLYYYSCNTLYLIYLINLQLDQDDIHSNLTANRYL